MRRAYVYRLDPTPAQARAYDQLVRIGIWGGREAGDVMQALQWLYQQGNRCLVDAQVSWHPGVDGGDATCWLCGTACPAGAPSQPARLAIPDTFTEYAVVRCAHSGWACPACASYFTGVAPLVTYPHRVTPTRCDVWERATMRADLERVLLDGVLDEPTVFAIVSSRLKRRHVLPLAPATLDASRVAVQLDAHTAWFTPADWRAITGPFDQLRVWGHSKTELLTGRPHPAALARDAAAGRLAAVLALQERLAPWRGSIQFEVAAYVSPGGDLTASGEAGSPTTAADTADDERSNDGDEWARARARARARVDGASQQHTGHARAGAGRSDPARGLGRDRQRVQDEVPPLDLGAAAESRGGTGAHDQRSGDIRQPALWDV